MTLAVKRPRFRVTVAILIVLVGVGVLVLWPRRDEQRAQTTSAAPSASASDVARRDALPGQARTTIVVVPDAGSVEGRVIDGATGEGVEGAELTFVADGVASSAWSGTGGAFTLASARAGRFELAAIARPGYWPYAPELGHSTIAVHILPGRSVRGVVVFLFPAVEFTGYVVDQAGKAVADARVHLRGTPTGEQAIDGLETEWTTDRAGKFTFRAADDAVLEASRGNDRGWARVDGDVAITRQLVIKIDETSPRTATIRGRTVDSTGKPIADVLVRAEPVLSGTRARPGAFATSADDGTFELVGLEQFSDAPYEMTGQRFGYATAVAERINAGSADVTLVLERGLTLAGTVVDRDNHPVPSFTLLVLRRDGVYRPLVSASTFVDPSGRFEVRVAPGEYDVTASSSGVAPSEPVSATAPASDLRLVVSVGATLRGQVIAADGSGPIPHARILREAPGGGASATPANAGTVTRADGTFELTGLPPGPVSITVGAVAYHPLIEAGLTAYDGATLGPLTIALTRLAPGERPTIELVGIGVQLSADADAIHVDRVIAGSGAEAAGIVRGDRIVQLDGLAVAQLGLDRAIAKIRGVPNTTISVTLEREDGVVTLVVRRQKLRA